jgi:hypothetical protein
MASAISRWLWRAVVSSLKLRDGVSRNHAPVFLDAVGTGRDADCDCFGVQALVQNLSHAVMAQRIEPKDSRDDFPTPPWATRALIEHVIGGKRALRRQSCLEPACGAGHMARPLQDYFKTVQSSDVHDYGFGDKRDFLTSPFAAKSVDWIITNPPFRLADAFILRSLAIARNGVAMLARTVFLESIGRYDRIFRDHPPTTFAQFTERVPMLRGRLERNASTATGYAWFVWEFRRIGEGPQLAWIPPCRRELERVDDYPSASAISLGGRRTSPESAMPSP